MLRLVPGSLAANYGGTKDPIIKKPWTQKQHFVLHHTFPRPIIAPKATLDNQKFGRELEKKKEEEKAQVDVWKYVFAYVDLAVVKCAIELGIADVLESHGEPMTLSHLSSALGCSQSYLYRIMRFLIHRNVFNQTRISQDPGSIPARRYVNTPISRLLTTKGEKSMAALVMLESSPVMLAPWHALSTRVRSNENPPFNTHNSDIWSFNAANPEHSKLVDEAVASDARLVMPGVIARCQEVFEGVETVVDVGGGNGTAMGILVKACPWIKAINFDLPHVASVAPDHDGVKHVQGDMFVDVPKADVAFLLWVLHDWGDEECIKILRKCKGSISRDNGKVIIVDAVIDDDEIYADNNNEKDELECVRLMLDMVMLAHTNNGKERTHKEWDHLLTQAGFTSHVIKPIQAIQSVIVAFP